MCNIQNLSETEEGYVIYCQECRVLQIAFGFNMVMNINEEDFLPLVRNICSQEIPNVAYSSIAEEQMLLKIDKTRHLSLSYSCRQTFRSAW